MPCHNSDGGQIILAPADVAYNNMIYSFSIYRDTDLNIDKNIMYNNQHIYKYKYTYIIK